METTFSTAPLRRIFGYIFRDPHWVGKVLILLGICFANYLVPILPMILICGYLVRVMHPIIVDGEEPALPEWQDWGKLLADGLRMFGAILLYSIPAILFAVVGMGSYFGFVLAMPFISEQSSNSLAMMIPLFASLGLMLLFLGLSTFFGLIELFFLPAAVGHLVARDSFKAGFEVSGWWKIFRANLGGYLIALILFIGLYTGFMLVGYIFYYSIVLCMLMFVVMLVGSVYTMLVMAPTWALVYREGIERLGESA
jgi:hypothetical protein